MHMRFSGPEEILDQLVARYPVLASARDSIWSAYGILSDSFEDGNKLLICGNGGSAADALHIAGELMKSFVLQRKPDAAFTEALYARCPEDAPYLSEKLERALPAVALVDNPSVFTAVQNDTGSRLVFAQQVYGLGKMNDVLLGISTSGNSENVILAAETAQAIGMHVITLTGPGPNRLTSVSDCQIAVDGADTFLVQELHLPVYHALCLMLEHHFFAG